jgi:hypothetical protein
MSTVEIFARLDRTETFWNWPYIKLLIKAEKAGLSDSFERTV